MVIRTFPVGPLACNCTVVANEKSGEAIVVDGGDGVDEVAGLLERNGWRAKFLVHTHAHIDHIGDLGKLRERTGAAGLLHPGDLPLYGMLEWQAQLLGLNRAPRIVPLDGELHNGDRKSTRL